MFASATILTLVALLPSALASGCDAWTGGVPKAVGTVSSKQVIEVAAGKTFNCGWKRYDRGSGACSGQSEGDWEDAVFYLHKGAKLEECIIGANQAEGVHCDGHCTLQYVWFEDVCEDAISIKNDKAGDETWILGGGAYNGDDKIVQHNGCGTVNIINFYVEEYGKLYRSCGNCDSQCKRTINISGVIAKDGGELAGINKAYGDVATLKNNCADTSHQCVLYNGCSGDCEASKVGYC